MAFISNASVTVMPLNPKSLFSKSCMAFEDKEVAYLGLLSIAGTDKCPTITDSIPASIKALKGASSISVSCSMLLLIIGIST